MDMNLSELQAMVTGREAWRAAAHGAAESRTLLSDCTTKSRRESERWGVLWSFARLSVVC